MDGPAEEAAARTLLLTGPNMGGKSTLLRATCLAAIMAHVSMPITAWGLHCPQHGLCCDLSSTRKAKVVDALVESLAPYLIGCVATRGLGIQPADKSIPDGDLKLRW